MTVELSTLGSVIKTAYEGESDTNAFSDAYKALLDAYDVDLGTFSVPANTTISAFGATLVDDADAATARATLGVDAAGTDNSTDVTFAYATSPELNYLTLTGQQITLNPIDLAADVTGALPIANISATGTPDTTTFLRGDGSWSVPAGSVVEGTAILSTGEAGGTKYLREDGDGTCSWQEVAAVEGTSILSTGPVTDGWVLTADGAGGAAWEAASGGGAFTADAQTQITPTTPIVLDEATGDEVALQLNYTVNKLTSGNDTGLLINQTDTASPGTSLLADFQVGGASKVSIDNTGRITVPSGGSSSFGLYSSGNLSLFGANGISLGINSGSYGVVINPSYGLWVAQGGPIGIGNGNTPPDIYLYRDAANTLALRNRTNAQTFNVYGTYTDSSNYERLAITGSAITVQTAGTGTDDIDLTLTPAGAGNVKFGTHSAIGAETVTGYITIKDSSGTTRKLAVVS